MKREYKGEFFLRTIFFFLFVLTLYISCSLFAGFVPRVMWITLGGAFFFGFYDLTSRILAGDSTTNV